MAHMNLESAVIDVEGCRVRAHYDDSMYSLYFGDLELTLSDADVASLLREIKEAEENHEIRESMAAARAEKG